MRYRTLWVVRHVMPDDRLAHGVADIDDGVIAVTLRHGFIHPALVQVMADFSKRFADLGPYEMDPDHVDGTPGLTVGFERVDSRFMEDLPMSIHFNGSFEIMLHEDLVRPELVREMNEEVMPVVCGVLVPVTYADAE